MYDALPQIETLNLSSLKGKNFPVIPQGNFHQSVFESAVSRVLLATHSTDYLNFSFIKPSTLDL